ncbi:uncharacterized protein Dwil_GK24236 [Drosophila willistoni]|uniref:Death domain-containing protein n=1 Tax=Drosophila willistoni TaxID=7260 RepID=A0A0Q9X2Z4_DROWI|nr:uncharacterized protein Dwil_GK24236 [Drosophila willistoni]
MAQLRTISVNRKVYAQPVDPDLTAKLLGRGVAVSPIVTVEPRRRKFHKAITLSMPAPKAHSQGMINQYSGNTPTLRLLCSITGGPSRAQWEDVTGSTPLTFVNDCVSFTTTVSARFWLMDCRNISDATKMATELYKLVIIFLNHSKLTSAHIGISFHLYREVIHVPFIAKFVVFAKKIEPFEARLRVFCMTDDREDKTLEKHELYTEVAKSRDVEVLEGKPQYIEMAGNLVPVTKSGDQLQLQFKAFRENRLPFTVRVKDQHADIVGRTLFMKEPKVAKGEPPQQPICILNIVLPEAIIPDSVTCSAYRTSMFSLSKHQNDHYIGDIRIVDLSNLLGKDWIQLAPEIGINADEIDEIINQNTDSIARQAQSMIRLYKDKPNYDILALESALKNIGRDDIMKKCKSGRLSHSREFDDTDIMKNSESVEELVRRESKRIQQINEREEVKYSAEEKEVEESESDEEQAKRTVAERREKIVKRLSMERSIPASTQKKEITKEITEIKRKSLIEDKKAIHESEILMQLPADNVIIKGATVPEQVIKMKMGKMDSMDVSKSEFDKELTHKFRSSGRSSEEEEISTTDKVDKIVQDISTAEKNEKKDGVTSSRVTSITRQEARDMTEDFLEMEKRSQLPAVPSTETVIHEKFVEEVKEKEKTSPMASVPQETIKEVEQVISVVTEMASKKVENIISSFESGKREESHEVQEEKLASKGTTTKATEANKHSEDVKSQISQEQVKTVEHIETTTIEEKIADFEAKKVKYDFHGGEPKTQIPKLVKKQSEEPLKPTAAPRTVVEPEIEKPEKAASKIPVKSQGATEVPKIGELETRKLTQEFLQGEQLAAESKPTPAASKIPKVEPRKSSEKLIEKETKILDEVIASTATIMTAGLANELPDEKITKQPTEIAAKAEVVTEKLGDLIDTFQHIEEKVITTEKSTADAIKADEVAGKVAGVVETFHKIEERITTADTRAMTHDFLAMEQQSQLPSMPQHTKEQLIQSSQTSLTASEPESVISVTKPVPPASKIPIVETKKAPTEESMLPKASEPVPKEKDAVQPLDKLQLTADFLSMEQQTQLQSHPTKELISTKEFDTILDAKDVKADPKKTQQQQIQDDGIELAAPIGEASPFTTRKLTSDFLAKEQQSQLNPSSAPSALIKDDGLCPPISIEPRKSLTDAEFCKSVGETITKKMSEGLIEITDELKQITSDIPHSQTPPPTPSDTKVEKQTEEATPLISLETDYLADTVTTLHSTTESSLERVSAISIVEMSTSSQTAKTITTTTMTTTLTTTHTKIDLRHPESGSQETADPESTVDADIQAEGETASDSEYLEQIMSCGVVRRNIIRLESNSSTEQTEPSSAPKYIGDNVPVVKEVVQSIEDKICGSVVSAVPFVVQKRPLNDDMEESDIVELEKQILSKTDLTLQGMIKYEPPAQVITLSPIEAIERSKIDLEEIQEEVCEKICEKRKSFIVAQDLSETDKTFAEQVIDLDRQVEQVPGSILTKSIDEHKDLVSKDTLETLPKVREVVQDIERRYPTASLEAKPFSPRKRDAHDRKVDVLTIEQQILSETDLILDNLNTLRHIPEQKIVSPVLSGSQPGNSFENLEDACEKKCSKRLISNMAEVFEKQPDTETKSVADVTKSKTAKFLEYETYCTTLNPTSFNPTMNRSLRPLIPHYKLRKK